jgi:hypothetical protein
MKTAKLVLFALILFITATVSAQVDRNPNSVMNVDTRYGITPQELEMEKNAIKPTVNPPAELFTQLDAAKRNGNIQEAERINSEIQKYSVGTKTVIPGPVMDGHIAYPTSGAPFTPDWLGTDATIYNGYVAGAYNTANFRMMDMKMGKDGNIYVAFATDSSVAAVNRYLWVYRSTNSGATWSNLGGAYYNGSYFHGLSMSVDRRSATINDSVKVSVYYTVSGNSNGNGAVLNLFTFTVGNYGGTAKLQSIATPTTGRKIMYPSAVTDGAYYDAATYIGCVFGEYSNTGDSTVSIQMTRTVNWHGTYVAITIPSIYTGLNGDYYPSASLKRSTTGGDSVYIAVERRFSGTNYLIRVLTTPWSPTAANSTLFLPPTGTGLYTKPSLNIRQTASATPRDILITYMLNGVAQYMYSVNDGSTWSFNLSLDPNASTNSNAVWSSSDSLTTGSCFSGLWKAGDSICVRRGYPGNLGAGNTIHKLNSHQSTTSRTPVCVTYRGGGLQRSMVAFPGLGPQNVYFNSENLPTGISGNGTTPTSFRLSQNYPNPFNPTTNINFSIPKNELVKIKIYDILGKEVATVVNEQMNAGTYNISFDASKLSSGVYMYKIIAGSFSDIKKMMLIK